MQSPASKNFALLFSLTCIGAALKLIYSGIYLIGAPLLLIGVVWFASYQQVEALVINFKFDTAKF